jgi:hypothetical protein
MTFRGFLTKLGDWLLRTDAMRAARAVAPQPGSDRARAITQSRLLAEVARRVAEPVETLPPGARPPVLLGLYRDAIYWALVAALPEGQGRPADLEAAWAASDPEVLLRAAGDARALDAVRGVLLPGRPPGSLDATDDDAARARGFTEALLWQLDAPHRQLERVLAQRWSRVALAGVVVIAAVMGLRALLAGPNLAAGKPFRTSSSWAGCAGDPTCAGLLFHTNPELNPWVEFDLGSVQTVHRVDIANRTDCCSERAVPLVVEVSTDRVKWKQVGRRDTTFSSWTAKFPPTAARFVKLWVQSSTAFHLEEVAVR